MRPPSIKKHNYSAYLSSLDLPFPISAGLPYHRNKFILSYCPPINYCNRTITDPATSDITKELVSHHI